MSSKLTYEDVIYDYIGEIGVFQGELCGLFLVMSFFNQEGLAINVVSMHADHWCDIPRLSENFSHAQQKYIAIPGDDNGEYLQCHRFDVDFDLLTDEDIYTWNRYFEV